MTAAPPLPEALTRKAGPKPRHRPSSVNDPTPSPIILKEPVKRSRWRPSNGPSLLDLVKQKREEEGIPSVMAPKHRPSLETDKTPSPVVLKEPVPRQGQPGKSMYDVVQATKKAQPTDPSPPDSPVRTRQSMYSPVRSRQSSRQQSLSPLRRDDTPNRSRSYNNGESPHPGPSNRINERREKPSMMFKPSTSARKTTENNHNVSPTQSLDEDSTPEVRLPLAGSGGQPIVLPQRIPKGARRPKGSDSRYRFAKQPSDNKMATDPMVPYPQPLDSIQSNSRMSAGRSTVLSFMSKDESSPIGVEYFEENDFDTDKVEDWQNGKTLSECNQHMLTYEIDCDVTFLVGETQEPVRAHSYVLMSRTAILGEKIRSIDSPEKIIAIPEATPDSVRNMLTYIYTDAVDLDFKKAFDLIVPAHRYGIKSLKKTCFNYMLGEMYSDNVNLILEKAHQYSERDVYDRCLFFIYINAKDVMKTSNFRNLCRSCVDDIVKADELYADEPSVFEALVMWANSECTRNKMHPTEANRREILGTLLYRTRFATMDVREFAKKMTQREVLTQEEKIELYQYFHGQTSTLSEKFTRHPRKVYKIDERKANLLNSPPRHQFIKPEVPNFENPVLRVVRFRGMQGSWQPKGPDAISFKCTGQIVFRGIQVFCPVAGRESFDVELTVYDQQQVIRTEKINAFTENSKVYDVMLSEPILVPMDRLFTVVANMKGAPPTIRGIDGAQTMFAEGLDFEFINSNRSINGTDVTMGQIPAILFSKPITD